MRDDYLSIDDAIARRKRNPAARWPSRDDPDRLEPDCWPRIRPTFQIARDARIHTIGSCFARNIEYHFKALGLHVPSNDIFSCEAASLGGERLEIFNRYTPTSIDQELNWIAAILDRDDQVGVDDVVPLLLDIGNDRFLDLYTSANNGFHGMTLEQHLNRRRVIYRVNREAFFSDVVVITLGLIEAWWDLDTGKTIEFHPRLVKHPGRDRFGFRRLRFEEAYDATRKAVDLLRRDPSRKMLITTSPVPLGGTFTDDDVIVANTYSKSVLRAVVGAVVEVTEGVDYFPSFESVMLTKRREVWSDDLIHVATPFVGQIMARAVESYVAEGVETTSYIERSQFDEAVRAGRWDTATPLYETLRDDEAALREPRLALALAEYEVLNGLQERGLRHLQTAEANDPVSFPEIDDCFRCGRLYRLLSNSSDAERLYTKGAEKLRGNFSRLNGLLTHYRRVGWTEEFSWLLSWTEACFSQEYDALTALAEHHREAARPEDYHRLKCAALKIGGQAHDLILYVRQLEAEGRAKDAIAVILGFDRDVRDPAVFRKLLSLLFGLRLFQEAEGLILDRLARYPEDATAHGLHALVLSATQRPVPALEAGRKAIRLGADMPGVTQLVERLEARHAMTVP